MNSFPTPIRTILSGHGWICAAIGLLGMFLTKQSLAEEVAPKTTSDATTYAARIRPLFEKHCFRCHGADLAEGNLRLDTLAADFSKVDKSRKWTKILDRVESGEMP